jgi:hypothetical protein
MEATQAVAVSAVFFDGPIWWVPHCPHAKYAGHGRSIFLGDSFFIVPAAIMVAASVRLSPRRAGGLRVPRNCRHGLCGLLRAGQR